MEKNIEYMKDFNIDDSLGVIVAKTNHYMKSYFSKLILVKKGYVVRNIDLNDRRTYTITLTELGESVLEQLIKISDNANKAFISALNQDDYRELIRTLKTMTGSLEKLLSMTE